MGYIRKRIMPVLRKKSVLVSIFCGIVFALSISLLFIQQKQELDEEFKSMISNSLNIHTRNNVVQIDDAITEASNVLKMVEELLRHTDNHRSKEILERINTINPDFVPRYVTAEELASDVLSSLIKEDERDAYERLTRGETVVGEIHYITSLEGYYLPVILPMQEDGKTGGALYTLILSDGMLPDTAESVVYQDVQSCLITADGKIFFNTFLSEQAGNMFETLSTYGLLQTDIDRIADIIRSEEMDSTTFNRKGSTYFVSAEKLLYNDWYLVSFVRGPDVLLRSANIFKQMVRTSIISILLAAIVAGVVFIMFISGKNRLAQVQRYNVVLAHRLQAMFNQHSALKIVFDAVTGIIVDANPAILNYFGYTKTEVLGQNINEFNLLPFEIMEEK